MEVQKESAKSVIKVSDDVIVSIAKQSALDVKGVACLGGEVNRVSKIKKSGPIKVSVIGDVAGIDVKIKVKSGEKAYLVAQEVQKAVKENIQNMTNVPVARVNVTVIGAVFD